MYGRSEARWKGPLPTSFGSVPNKEALDLDGVPVYPELLIVHLLEAAGWGAAWRKNWGGTAYWRAIRDPITPPALPLAILEQVSRQAGHDTPWDIIAWRGRSCACSYAGPMTVSAWAPTLPTGSTPRSAWASRWDASRSFSFTWSDSPAAADSEGHRPSP